MTVPVIFSVNDQYVAPLTVAMTSLVHHVANDQQYHLIVLNDGLTAEHQHSLKQLARKNVSVDLVSMGNQFKQVLAGETGKLRGDTMTLTIFFRLFIAELFPEYDQAVYLDADTIIECDIAELARINLGHKLIAAAPDVFAGNNPEAAGYAEKVLGLPINQYINSGVLVMNLAQMRADHFSERFAALHAATAVETIAPDQDYLNAMCAGQVVFLPQIWNANSMATPKVDNPKIIHFCLFEKPWHYLNVTYAERFWHFAHLTPYESELLAQRNAYTAAEREHDREGAQALIARTVQMAQTSAPLINQ
ncbi:glycosyltransferase family 8 protein [Lactiplantibacillus sp. WILCCON 0030]|uniref:Glycosyltransferase family 8 protein n=1 Tax=Lactiplantibacillus brownii TaxID=3069269 RepID=A0ABU1AD92_9LACO|nr:glycosyltransferase family 8 protein [Lactiplantibacillus brownii]MDQ7938285.1 glycosyltransferase family 8 protein [Lactiplantibacillus brownii]